MLPYLSGPENLHEYFYVAPMPLIYAEIFVEYENNKTGKTAPRHPIRG